MLALNFNFSKSLFLLCVVTLPVCGQDRIAQLAGDGAVLLHSPDGQNLYSLNIDEPLVPASIVKIPLAQASLSSLGEEFRFETHFYTNESEDLLIHGLGDPFLVSEEVASIAATLAQQGIEEIEQLVVDDSAFEANPDLPLERGANDPYAARNSALAVNFNTVNLAWDAAGNLVSGESQTPLTALGRQLGAQLARGEAQRINLGNDPIAGLRQVHQLFLHFLQESGITVRDTGFARDIVNDDWRVIYQHRSSRSLQDNLEGMLRYSNNFIANQLFLTLGAQGLGYPATAQAARSALNEKLTELYGEGFGIDPKLLLMIEGSGLAREQRASANGMMQILEGFRSHADLLTETNNVLRKSGTLTGVYNFVGYIPGSGGLYPFVILTNQSANNRAEILRELQWLVNNQ